MAYHFYMGKMLCPVPPSKLQLKIGNNNKTMNLINEGEVNVLKQPGLTDVSFELLLPNIEYPFATYKSGFKNAKYFLDEIERLKTENKPFQFIVTRLLPSGKMLFDTNMKVSLESYDITESSENGFDVVVSIKLKQYREYGTKTCTISFSDETPKASVENTRSAENPPSTDKYTVVKNDCLWNIAKKFYGDGSKHTVIYNANKNIIEETAKKYGRQSSSNGHWIYPGTELTIPKI